MANDEFRMSNGARRDAAFRLLCVLCLSAISAGQALSQGIEIKTSNTSAEVTRFKVQGSGGVGVDANAYFLNAKLGIGTVTPDATLTIASSTSADQIVKVYSAGDAGLIISADGDDGAGEEDHNAYILLQQDGGTNDAYIGLSGTNGFDPRNLAYTGTLANYLLVGSTAVGEGVQFGSAGAVRMTVATGGFVGIGTTSPAQALDVNGTARVQGLRGLTLSGATTTNSTFGAWPGNAAANTWLYLSNGDTSAPAYTDLATGAFYSSGASYRANSDMYFVKTDHTHTGTGNTTGWAAIENSSNYNTLMLLGRAGVAGVGRWVRCWDRLDVNGWLVGHGNGTQNGTIITSHQGWYATDWPAGWGGGLSTWDVCCSGVYYNVLSFRSDRRLKQNVETLGDTLDRLQRLRPVSFDWKDPKVGGGGRNFGFIAQEVEEVMPELVSGSGDEIRSLAQSEMTPLLVRAQQELAEALRKECELQNALEARIARLERALHQSPSPSAPSGAPEEGHGAGQALNQGSSSSGVSDHGAGPVPVRVQGWR